MKRLCMFLLSFLLLSGCAVPAKEEPTVPETRVMETTVPETTQAPTTVPTEPPEDHFLLTFVGDCTFGANPTNTFAGYGFPKTVGEDYRYPFRNVISWFEKEGRRINAENENQWKQIHIALGVAVFDPEVDRYVIDTVRRADKIMYTNKQARKQARE